MVRIGVIGTAGRKDDAPLMSKELYDDMYRILLNYLAPWKDEDITLVSGGAAWADHLAVRAFLEQKCALELHLPAPFQNSKFLVNASNFQVNLSPGSIANFYHHKMSSLLGHNTLFELQRAIDKKAHYQVYDGFYARNLKVGNVDMLIAFTFGTHDYNGPKVNATLAGLKDGGSAHTWNNSSAKYMIHINLNELL